MIEWEVQSAIKLGRDSGYFRVQRRCRAGLCEGIIVSFTHLNRELCVRVARILNEWEKEDSVANVKDLFYHGVRQQIRRVLTAMGPERIEMGLTAFEDGASSWAACFFARAYPELHLDTHGNPEEKVAEALGMPGNKVPMRIVYRTFDSCNISMTKKELKLFCKSFLDEQISPEANKAIDELLGSINYAGAEETPIDFGTCAVWHKQQVIEPGVIHLPQQPETD